MTVTRRNVMFGGAALVALAAVVAWQIQQRSIKTETDWQREPTAPEGVVASPAMSWAAGGCPSITSACLPRTVGYRIRTYGPTLAADDESLIQEL